MTSQAPAAWWISSTLHALVLAVFFAFWVSSPPAPKSISIRLGSIPSSATKSEPASSLAVPKARTLPDAPYVSSDRSTQSKLPTRSSWKSAPTSNVEIEPPVVVDWETLVIPVATSAPEARTKSTSFVWEGAFDAPNGRIELPSPPKEFVTAQGADWTLVLTIPPEGGFPETIEGLSSESPELDRWLGDYLRAQSFPGSLDGKSYEVRWDLRLRTRLPE